MKINSEDQKKNRKPRFMRVKYDGRGLLITASLILLALSAYELYIRIDDLNTFFSAVKYMSDVKKESFIENVWILLQSPSMQELGTLLVMLVLHVILSMMCLIFSNRPASAFVIIPTDLAVLILTLMRDGKMSFHFADAAQILKIVPIIMILLGCVINVIERGREKRYCRRSSSNGD